MGKRQITVEIDDEGNVLIVNKGNSDESLILKELADMGLALNGDKQGFKVEEHVHTNGGHNHTHIHVGGKI